jgi:hypothetical protein
MNTNDEFRKNVKIIHRSLVTLFAFVGIVTCLVVYIVIDPDLSLFKSAEAVEYTIVEEVDEDKIENGIHVRTGLIDDEGLMAVVYNCTNCHSAKIVIQNRMNKERWAATIDWMQETQNLADLGLNEEIIINYLVKNYPPSKKGRRQALASIDWYELDE